MGFEGTGFNNSLQPHLSQYLNGFGHFNKSYYNQQAPAYPLFHHAAVAAVAAAAAGHSQHLGTRGNNDPLNLTSTQCYRSAYPLGAADFYRGAYYPNFGLHHTGTYSNTAVHSGFGLAKPSFPFPIPQPSASHLPTSQHTASCSNLPQTSPLQQPVVRCAVKFEGNHSQSGSTKHHSQKTGTKTRIKKSLNAEDAANRNRQEFDELIKARTEKLMSDGPLYSTTSVNGPLSSSSSGGGSTCNGTPARELSNTPNYHKLIEAVLDAKKLALLRSPSVISFLEERQRSLAEYKTKTESFCSEPGK